MHRITYETTRFYLVLLLAAGELLQGQVNRGQVLGTVADPSGAAIAAAKVTLHNVNTGVDATKDTDASGTYRFEYVVPGTYTVSVVAAAFDKFVSEIVTVMTAGDVTVNAQMTVGGVPETITVSAIASTVAFNTSSMTTTIPGEMFQNIPVLALNPFTLALLNPAVINQYWDVSHRNPFYMWSNGGLDIGGSTAGKNDQLLDGVPLRVAARGSYNPPMDAVQELVVQQNSVDAEYGFSAGGVLNLSMKSGTNEFHGSAYYLGRNPDLNAMTNRITQEASVDNYKIWGGTIGNPVKKNKLFNFFAYEQWRTTQPLSNISTVPTDLERAGDFSQTKTPDGSLRVMYDPWSTKFDRMTSTATRTPFPDNKIPSDRIDPTGRKAISDLWKPNRSGDDASGLNNFKTTYPIWAHYWNISERGDYNPNDKMRFYARFSKFETRLDSPNWGNTIAVSDRSGGVMDALNAAADLVYTISPKTTVNARLGVTYVEDDYDSAWAQVKPDVWANLFPSGWYKPAISSSPAIYYPNFNFNGNGTASTGLGGWWLVRERQYNWQVSVTHDMGIHHWKFGYQDRFSYEKNGTPSQGGFNFDSVDTGESFLGYTASQSGSQFASTLLGVVNSGRSIISPMWDAHMSEYALYANDDIRLNRNVTLNLGLRWEYETAPVDVVDKMFTRYLDLTKPIPELQGIQMPAEVKAIASVPYKFDGTLVFTDSSHPGVYKPQKSLFLPRAGVAIRLSDKMSFRAGYARYAVPIQTIHAEGSDIPKFGYEQSTSVFGPLEGRPRTVISDPFPATNSLRLPPKRSLGAYTQLGSSVNWFNQNLKAPLNDRVNFSLQRQMPGKFLFDGTFFMNFGHNVQDLSMWGGSAWQQMNMVDPNLFYTYKGAMDAAVPNPVYKLLPANKMPGELGTQETVAASQLLRPYPQYTDLYEQYQPGFRDHYYAMQLQGERPISRGIGLLVGYNYNHELHSQFFNDLDTYNRKFTMMDGGSNNNPRHNLRVAGTWELPFGKGRPFLSHLSKTADYIVGGWATSHLLMWQSGRLLMFGPALVTGDPRKNVPSGYWFNPAVFETLPAYTPRTNPWYYEGLRGPHFWSLDSTLVKCFRIGERHTVEVRLEFYNMPNHFIPSDPDVGIGNGTMAKSTWVFPGNYGREVQYRIRYHF